jgi:hypothetical protein
LEHSNVGKTLRFFEMIYVVSRGERDRIRTAKGIIYKKKVPLNEGDPPESDGSSQLPLKRTIFLNAHPDFKKPPVFTGDFLRVSIIYLRSGSTYLVNIIFTTLL